MKLKMELLLLKLKQPPVTINTTIESEQPVFTDLAEIVRENKTDVPAETKLSLINCRQPEKSFKFPAKEYKDKGEKSGIKRRYCSRDWFTHHDYLSYSKSLDGLYCLCCVLFPACPSWEKSKKT